jgi:uncharacterized surface protein with fasciclin (FAS1) repeats
MKRLVVATGIAIALAAAPAFAHCGKCGSGESHEHGASNASMNIVGTAESAGSFNTLIAAVKAAGLEDTLASGGPYTVFAPTDAAFAKLPAGTVDTLIAKPDQLREILLYHVVPGNVTSDQVVKLDRATTAQGSDVTIAVRDGSVMIDNATVTQADIQASNGVIHVIDTVILPSS